ncbi:neuronal acetylcholine receptor subunit alpha-10-like [Amphiura filiformis]|uniref:neuronal acetylcholine receptor subunit alpha-10-like n=1 Tax=Amphiura filiformis TaxID=82378 RepID=UPI003B21CB2F
MQSVELNTREQVFSIQTWSKLTWTDEFLTWNPKDYNGIRRHTVPVSKIWVPDITLYDRADIDVAYKADTVANIYPDGTIMWYALAIYRSTCKIHVRWFPFDVQVCILTFSSWNHDGLEIDLYPEHSLDANTSRFLSNGVWAMVAVRTKQVVTKYLCCPEPYPEVRYNLVFKHHAAFYIYYMILPCLALSILSLVVFYLPPDCGEKLTYSVTNLLALIVFQQIIAANIPPTSDDPPLIGLFFLLVVLLFLFLVYLCYIFVQNSSDRESKDP